MSPCAGSYLASRKKDEEKLQQSDLGDQSASCVAFGQRWMRSCCRKVCQTREEKEVEHQSEEEPPLLHPNRRNRTG